MTLLATTATHGHDASRAAAATRVPGATDVLPRHASRAPTVRRARARARARASVPHGSNARNEHAHPGRRDLRREVVAAEPRPKAKRLRAGRAHRKALLASLPPEQVPIAEQLFAGGLPAVRQAIATQNDTLKAEGKPEVPAKSLVALAEQMLPQIRSAEWRDRADAALADVDEIDLRDLRSVVGADDAARDEESRAIASHLREALTTRVEKEHSAWLDEIGTALDESRIVRALRLSTRPPKAGARFPAPLAARLTEAAGVALERDGDD